MLLPATLTALLLTASARADPIVLTLDSTVTVAPGGPLTSQGTFANTRAPGRLVNAAGFDSQEALLISPLTRPAFFAAVPAFTVKGFTKGAGPITIFTVLVSPSAAPWTHRGSWESESRSRLTHTAPIVVIPKVRCVALPQTLTSSCTFDAGDPTLSKEVQYVWLPI